MAANTKHRFHLLVCPSMPSSEAAWIMFAILLRAISRRRSALARSPQTPATVGPAASASATRATHGNERQERRDAAVVFQVLLSEMRRANSWDDEQQAKQRARASCVQAGGGSFPLQNPLTGTAPPKYFRAGPIGDAETTPVRLRSLASLAATAPGADRRGLIEKQNTWAGKRHPSGRGLR